MLHLWGTSPLDRDECRTQHSQHVQLLLSTLGGVWERLEDLPALREMADRFQIGRALERLLPSPLPVGNGLFGECSFGVMLCQQLRLRLGGIGKLCFQYLRKALVNLLPCTPEQ